MTIQLSTTALGTSKKALQDALNVNPRVVIFTDPSIFSGSRGVFTGDTMPIGDKFTAVLDHPKRMRFATVERLADGHYKVS